MKNIGTILAAMFLATVLLLYMCTYQVRFTEVAIVKTWGKPHDDAITEPGLRFKWPRPIQAVVTYDNRVRILDTRAEETRTRDGKNLIVTTFAFWKILDPGIFHTNFPAGVVDGEKTLRTTIADINNEVIGNRDMGEFVSSDPSMRRLSEIEEQIQGTVATIARDKYGIEIVGFGIKKLALPSATTNEVFASMKAHEGAKADRYIGEGNAAAEKIVADAKATEERILAVAREKVADIENEAQQIVSVYYKEFDQSPELRIFLDKLRTVAEALRRRTTIIIDTSQSPWDVFDSKARAGIAGDRDSGTPGVE